MKSITLVLCGVCLLFTAATSFAQRTVEPLSTGWRFIKRDVALDASTSDWKSVTVPHTWNAQDGQLGEKGNPGVKGGYYRGPAWYARSLDVPAGWKGKRIFIRFEAASLVAKTYLNGHQLGEHRGGFTAFCYELTPYLHFGGSNELRVQVDNSHQKDVGPLGGDFNVDGGLYRPVQLIVTDPVCVTPLDFASPGVYLTTQSLDRQKATVEVRTLVSNGESVAANVSVGVEIKDANGKTVETVSKDQSVPPSATGTVTQNVTMEQPHLWNARKDPYLYSVVIHVLRDGREVDSVTQPLGLRTVAITEKQGFLLNGQPYPIYGVNRHQDMRDKGWALSPADHDADAKIILDMGATAIRLAHYPQSEYFHDICDRNGLLLWNEVPLVSSKGFNDTPEFAANAELQLREMILQRYNHPSATFWGLFNELGEKPPPDALLTRLKEVAQSLDPSRLIVGASNKHGASFNKIPTWICFNGYPGWYGKGEPRGLSGAISDHFKEIGHRVGLSEYGAGANPSQHEEGAPKKIEAKGQFHPEEWQTYVHEREWAIIKNNPHLWGTFVWVMFDMPSAGRDEGGQTGLNDKGLVTQDRKTRKDAYFFYKANWNPEPMVYIASRRSTPRKMPSTPVEIFCNCSEVELRVNGQSIGKAKPNDVKVAHWDNVALRPGMNKIEALAQSTAGKQLYDSCEWVLEDGLPSTK